MRRLQCPRSGSMGRRRFLPVVVAGLTGKLERKKSKEDG